SITLCVVFHFYHYVALPDVYSLSLHDALPISRTRAPVRLAVLTISRVDASRMRWSKALSRIRIFWPFIDRFPKQAGAEQSPRPRSEEHTSELQSRENIVCRLLLGKKHYKLGFG